MIQIQKRHFTIGQLKCQTKLNTSSDKSTKNKAKYKAAIIMLPPDLITVIVLYKD